MLLIGFSTGAVALGDFERALVLMSSTSMTAVELSALRLPELPRLVEALPRLNLRQYSYVSVHAPSRFSESEEGSVVELLQKVPKNWPIILHPDTIYDCAKWREFGSQLAIENLDRRKELGRSAEELKYWFERLPEARLCLDLAHAHQVDRTMTEAYRILKTFKLKVCQLHVSELDSTGHHHPLSLGSMRAFTEIESMIPVDAAIILESLNPLNGEDNPVQVRWIEQEAQRACQALRRNEQDIVSTGSTSSVPPLNRAVTA
jgi:hypothetical protein